MAKGKTALQAFESGHDKAFSAIRKLNSDTKDGITSLGRDDFFINVHRYPTQHIDDCRFEGHHHTIDLQYIIHGGEQIDWCPRGLLQADGDYLIDEDVQFYKIVHGACFTRLVMRRRHFAIFFPEDLHRPQIALDMENDVIKAVVKIPSDLLIIKCTETGEDNRC